MDQKRSPHILEIIREQFAAISTFIILLSLAFFGFLELKSRTKESYERQFGFRARLVTNAIEARMYDYSQILKGAKGLIVSTDTFSRKAWHRYLNTFNLERNFPGLQGVGYAPYLRYEEMDEFVEQMRQREDPQFTITPLSTREVYVPIVHLEPMDWRNQRAIGFDMFSEPVRQEAMIRARDNNQLALSGKVILVQEVPQGIQAGFLLFLPVYQIDSIPSHPHEGHKMMRGFIYSPLRATDFAKDIFQDNFNDVDIEIYDGVDPTETSLLYNKDRLIDVKYRDKIRISQLTHLQMAGRTWSVFISPRPLFWSTVQINQPLLFLIGGVLISFLLSMIIWVLSRNRKEVKLKQTITDNASAGLMLLDGQAYCTYLNSAARELTGYEKEDLIDRKIWSVLSPEENPQDSKFRQFLRTPGDVRNKEFLIKSKQGTVIECSLSKTVLYSNDRISSVVLEIRDITRENAALREATASAERFQFLANAMPEKVWTTNPEGRVNYLNQRWFDLQGSEQKALEENVENVWQLVHPDDLALARPLFRESVSSGEVFQTQMRLRDKHGNYRWHLARGIPQRDADGKIIMWIGATTDIDDQKRSEELLRQNAEQLHAVNEELNEFASVVSHDLKAPLRAIGTLADFLILDCDYLKGPDKDNLTLIKERVKRMEGLINGILSYSRIGKEVMEHEPVYLKELVEDVVDHIKPPANIKVKVEELPVVRYIRTQLFQLFQNIIDNAVKYNDKSEGLITVSGRMIDEGFEFTIADNGPGVEERYFQRIFKMFQTLSPRDKRESTGIGLTIVQKIIKNMGGRIWLESEIGVGTKVKFIVPSALVQTERIYGTR